MGKVWCDKMCISVSDLLMDWTQQLQSHAQEIISRKENLKDGNDVCQEKGKTLMWGEY